MKNDSLRTVQVIETEVYSRVVGYYRPVQNWNSGKKLEFSQRKLHTMPGTVVSNSLKSALKMVG
ncbi:anaerobic ribonucleoside-triphosphate reductase [Myxococcota bacterium]|jgi:hypothetical protein|nr:anaerobic ribonucleoside-triphosphate reductase [Myxococcota bacterium]MBU1243174.1 anaerobic ribonucleoside-triphosphate reductase [Myxococcota bacterium]MBU1413652.1 anaerobic ribonucleoside-triphosphate reductase [Myxococcota bacterium]MBU1511731.1 anaerobic ribonucleoside-triphosphate reductase [Myxococcota bacterium]PKN26789.1 MAG: hypothetical protein CVU65_04655 [Deltaproteobacteria bacterium HGW-Deltaproteobacteria-22]